MTSENFEIKTSEPVTSKDLNDILALIENNIVKFVTTLEHVESYSCGEILIARDGDGIVGALMMRKPGKVHKEFSEDKLALDQYGCDKNDIGYIIYVVTDQKHQGKGIGKALVKEALKRQKEWGAKAIGVHAWQGSPGNASQKLFESMGFKAIKMHKAPWEKMSAEMGPEGYFCPICSNPCKCDELEMVKYLLQDC